MGAALPQIVRADRLAAFGADAEKRSAVLRAGGRGGGGDLLAFHHFGKIIHCNMEQFTAFAHRFEVGLRKPVLPLADRLAGDVHLLTQFGLRHVCLFSQLLNHFSVIHTKPP